ncbi:MAG: OsmC family protein, partial [Candidatus Eremiobacteraeota bacterium]|nr:OsmC family protein [Candidatus Eremiobacteraeota bacterium]
GLSDEQCQEVAKAAEAACPVSNALRGGVKIELNARLT